MAKGAGRQLGAVVTGREGALWRVRVHDRQPLARRGRGCLVQPEPGDLVLLLAAGAEPWPIVAVLERSSGASTRLVAEGDVELRVGGRLALHAACGMSVASGRDCAVLAPRLRLQAAEAVAQAGGLSLVAERARFELGQLLVRAARSESRVGRVLARLGQALRRVAETDRVRAREIDAGARETLAVRGRATVLRGEKSATVHGGQIHCG
ncbi:MAG: DUF3540 domain-containing protein [Deltaproteobacteria bacterium]|nr:DUF3540 domain-containing protein [Deltaproteobacteria bacterium]